MDKLFGGHLGRASQRPTIVIKILVFRGRGS